MEDISHPAILRQKVMRWLMLVSWRGYFDGLDTFPWLLLYGGPLPAFPYLQEVNDSVNDLSHLRNLPNYASQ